jgi:hypothetical protein
MALVTTPFFAGGYDRSLVLRTTLAFVSLVELVGFAWNLLILRGIC